MKIADKGVSKVLSHHENKALQEEEQKLQDIKDEVELNQGVKYEVEDIAALEARLKQIKEMREKHGARELSESERGKLEKKAATIKKMMHEINPTFKQFQYARPTDGPSYSRLVRQIANNDANPEYQAAVREWQDCQRMLYPDDPFAADTRQLYAGGDA